MNANITERIGLLLLLITNDSKIKIHSKCRWSMINASITEGIGF